jgi:hypothetical protein
MSHPITTWNSSIIALDVRSQLLQLQKERVLALREGLGGTSAYMNDLDAELEHRRALYVAAAVTEIATLRAELFGPQAG